jgi:glucokinase
LVAQGVPGAAALLDRAGGRAEAITGPMVTAAAQDGDGFAAQQLEHLGRWLGEGIATLAEILDPQVVVVGGGVSEAGDLVLEPLRRHYRASLSGLEYRPELEVKAAQLGNRAGLIGAADLARRL